MLGAIAAIGMSTALGASRAETLAGLAEGAVGLRRLRGFMGDDYRPQLTALTDEPDDKSALQQMGALADAALTDLVGQLAGDAMGTERTGLRIAICLPEPDAGQGLPADHLHRFGTALAKRAGDRLGLPVEGSTLHFDGGAGVGIALSGHRAAVMGGTSLLVIAVDSYRCRSRLNALIAGGRLFSDLCPYGLIPGEAAVAVLVRGAPGPQDHGHLLGVGTGQDTVGEFDDGDSDYTALSDACHAALPADHTLTSWVTDWNNSRYRAAETSYAQLRMSKRMHPDTDVTHPALMLGDTGAAGQGIGLAMAAYQGGVAIVTGSGPSARVRSVVSVARVAR